MIDIKNSGIFKDGHVTNNGLLMSESNSLLENEKILLLSHLSECDDCMDRFLNFVEQDLLVEPFEGLEENISLNISDEYAKKKEKERHILFLQYCKLAVAVCLTIVIFWGGASNLGGSLLPQPSASGAPSYEERQKPKEYEPIEKKTLEELKKKDIMDSFGSFSRGLDDTFTKFTNIFTQGLTKGENTK